MKITDNGDVEFTISLTAREWDVLGILAGAEYRTPEDQLRWYISRMLDKAKKTHVEVRDLEVD